MADLLETEIVSLNYLRHPPSISNNPAVTHINKGYFVIHSKNGRKTKNGRMIHDME